MTKAITDKTEKRRQEIIGIVAMHLVRDGFQNSGLRAIAKSVGMSDRMIMYYFETKEELIAEALSMVGENLADGMEQSLPEGKGTVNQVLAALLQSGQSAEVKAVMRLWFEIIGLSMRGQEPYQKTVAQLLERSEERIRGKLRADQKHRAREVLARLEGELMLGLLMPV